MPEVKSKNTETVQSIKLMASDLSALNGVSEKINTEYLKNIQQIILYSAAEMIRDGAEEISIDIPFLGTINIVRKIYSSTKKNNRPSYKFTYTFSPNRSFDKGIKLAFEDGFCELPDMLAEKYGKKLLAMYEKFLND